ncbi:MAG: hypothetical protein WAS27_04070 [Candidatus Saccharimonadales bacterium]
MASPNQLPGNQPSFDAIIDRSIAPTFRDTYQYRSINAAFAMQHALSHTYDNNGFAYIQAIHESIEHSTIAAIYARHIDTLQPLCLETPSEYLETADYIDSGFIAGLELAHHTVGDNMYSVYMVQSFTYKLLPYLTDSNNATIPYDRLVQLGINWYTHRETYPGDMTNIRPAPLSAYDDPHQPIVETLSDALMLSSPESRMQFAAGFGLATMLEEDAAYIAWLSDTAQ